MVNSQGAVKVTRLTFNRRTFKLDSFNHRLAAHAEINFRRARDISAHAKSRRSTNVHYRRLEQGCKSEFKLCAFSESQFSNFSVPVTKFYFPNSCSKFLKRNFCPPFLPKTGKSYSRTASLNRFCRRI